MRESGGKRWMAGVAEKRATLAAEKATRKIGYRCEGLSARGYSRPSERPRCVAILV